MSEGLSPGAIATGAVEEARLFRALHELAVAVGGLLDQSELARVAAAHTRELLGADGAAVQLWDAAAGVLRAVYVSDPAVDSTSHAPIPLDRGTAGRAFLLGRPVVAPDYANWEYALPWLLERGIRSSIAVPLVVAEKTIGTLSAGAREPHHISEREIPALTLLAAQVAPALEAARLYAHERQARADADALLRAREEFAAAISHDLQNPLATIVGQVQLLQRRIARGQAPSPETLSETLTRVETTARVMVVLIQELLQSTRSASLGASPLSLAPVDLVALSQRVAQQYAATTERHEILIRQRVPALVGRWDQARLERVLGNLLSNALKYSPAGGEIVVDVSHDDPWAVLRVSDEGVGIPLEDQPFVFEPYRRSSQAPTGTSGLGLGLASARAIVEQHGGRISVASREGEGSTFSVWLPLAAASSSAVAA